MKSITFALFFALGLAGRLFAQDVTELLPLGAKVTLVATADGNPAPKLLWLKDGVQVGEGDTLSIAALALADAGTYTVTATNALGSVTSDKYILQVGFAPTKPVIKSTFSVLTVDKQSAVSFKVAADGTAPLSFQWYKNGLPLNGQTSSTLAFAKVNPSYTGRYAVNVWNTAGKTSADIVELRVR